MLISQPLVRIACGAFAGLLLAMSAEANINKSIHIQDGEQSEGRSTVNGSVTVGSGAVISGSVETVNGSIKVADNVRLESASTVNGSIQIGSGFVAERVESVNGRIRIGGGASVSGTLETVNGSIRVDEGSEIVSDVQNVNGEIHLEGSEIGGDITTVGGDVFLSAGSVLRGDLVIEKPKNRGFWRRDHKPRVVIGANSRVLGTIRAEREIELLISDSAEVAAVSGEATMDDAQRFDGDRP